ncbi:MAG: hypothetical protein COW56_02520 [Rhodocyclales bacterium CG17_big_fil_post_rev_8_21_14_2_50_68_7]|nr:MAG: hypothetical protein COW56_02520 [Rhodocyclales bacterium CG17_big_fil_post_rev_8_21_14_2_50_68_7]
MKRPAVLLAVLLLLICASLLGYRVLFLDYPALPGSTALAWNLTIQALVKGEPGKDIRIEVALPEERGDYTVTEERIESGLLTFELVREGWRRSGVWSGTASKTP